MGLLIDSSMLVPNGGEIRRSISTPIFSAQLRDYQWQAPQPQPSWRSSDFYFLNVCLRRSEQARGCYPERWGSSRYEAIGDIFFIPVNQRLTGPHERPEPHVFRERSLACFVAAAQIPELPADLGHWNDVQLVESLHVSNPTIRRNAMRLVDEVRAPGFAGALLAEALCIGIVVETLRHLQVLPDQTRSQTGGLAPWRLRLIEERVHDQDAAPTIDELAHLCRLTPRHLMRAYRTETGQTLGDHVAAVRLERAKGLLVTGDMLIKQIATTLGYADPASFSHAFRKATGMSPVKFREEARIGGSGAPTECDVD